MWDWGAGDWKCHSTPQPTARILTRVGGMGWSTRSLHEQMRRDATFVDEIAFRQKDVFVRDVSLFPTEMRYAMDLAG